MALIDDIRIAGKLEVWIVLRGGGIKEAAPVVVCPAMDFSIKRGFQ